MANKLGPRYLRAGALGLEGAPVRVPAAREDAPPARVVLGPDTPPLSARRMLVPCAPDDPLRDPEWSTSTRHVREETDAELRARLHELAQRRAGRE